MLQKIPKQVLDIISKIKEHNFEGYIVGGCVRDLLLNRNPKDWDIATNAKPEEILNIFGDKAFYTNEFFTVGIKTELFLPSISEKIKINKQQKEESLKIAKKYLSKISCSLHNQSHAESIFALCKEIAKDYPEVNIDLLELMAFFHDAGRSVYDDDRHIIESGKIARKELKNIFNKQDLDLLVSLFWHGEIEKCEYIEQRILNEADIIDIISLWRIKKAQEEGVEKHIKFIKENYQALIPKLAFSKSREILKDAINKVNKELNIKLGMGADKPVSVVEVTTYRIESAYNDKRHPDEVRFADNLEDDLKRRDFTVNALAFGLRGGNYEIIDLFDGQKDLKNKIIKAVGKPDDRFNEDALRMMRAIRFYCELPGKWEIEESALQAIKTNGGNLKFVSNERIKDELTKIILSERPADGIQALHKTGLLHFVIPELEIGVGVSQNRHHIYSIFEHLVLALKNCPSRKLEVRLAALFHDIAKPQTKRGEGEFSTFYNHDHLGAKITRKILARLKFSNKVIDQVSMLVDNHMFYYNPDEVGASSVRKLIKNVGLENMKDLVDLRIADRLGSGVPKAKPYKLRHLEYMVDKVSGDATSVKMLVIGGNDLMKELQIKPGPQIGAILDVLLAEVIEEAEKNNYAYLLKRSKELAKEDLRSLHKLAKIRIDERKWEEDQELKKKHWVK